MLARAAATNWAPLLAVIGSLQLAGLGLGLGLGLEDVLVFDIKSENRDRAAEAIEAVSEARAC